MIVLYHNHNKVTKIISKSNEISPFDKTANIASVFIELAIQNPQSKIVWCHENYHSFLNLDLIESLFYHDKIMLSFNPDNLSFLGEKIGYIDESPFIKINKKVSYPTWLMSSSAGIIHAAVLLEVNNKIKPDSDFAYYLSSIAKVCMPLGLLCYSEPRLLKNNNVFEDIKPSNIVLFKFVKQHYRTRWIFLLFLNLMIYELKFPVFALFYSLFFKNRNKNTIKLDKIKVNSSLNDEIDLETVDVLIPTIGRKKYLYDVLSDLLKQTHLPENVIIVEQNPDMQSTSELDYLDAENWPFKIKHTFITQTGACNARNVALSQVESKWIFFADDDIRFNENFIESAVDLISQYKCKAVSFRCFQENEKQTIKEICQWSAFGSGCSFVNSKAIKNVQFDLRYEFGFGEDTDFGMQIRNLGCDVLYFPTPEILHLKAPIGGFRTKPSLLWSNDEIKPKPSPTITLYKLLHETKEQHNGYKTILFFKYYRNQSVKNPIKYYFKFQKEWKRSLYWANKLINKA